MTDPAPPPTPADPTAAPASPEPRPPRERPPVPALGVVLGAAWLLICSASRTYPQVLGYPGQMPFLVATNALGAVLLVAVPLLLRQIPDHRVRQATPFLVLAGLAAVGAGLVGGTRMAVVLLVNASVLYVIGWLRLRGRDPLLTLLALATPVLYGLGAVAGVVVATQPSRRILVSPVSGLWTSLVFVAALVLGVLPVGVPVLVAGLLSRRVPSAPAGDAVPADPSVGPAPGLNSSAVAALVLSLTGGSILAVVFGHLAQGQISRGKGTGGGLAVGATLLGYLGVLVELALGFGGNLTFWFVFFTSGR